MPRAVLVAGGTGALGAGVLRELLDSGHPVAATWVEERERERVERDFAGDAGLTLVEADCFDPDAAARAVTSVDDLGAVVNLIGGFFEGPLAHETDVEDFDRMLRLNLRPAFLLARAAMPVLLESGGGAFVAVSARPALRPYRGSSAYSTSKAAVLAFVRALDADYAKQGVRSNAILPSVIDTPANRKASPDADYDKWVKRAEIAKVVRFLVSDDSAPTSGAAIPVYGKA